MDKSILRCPCCGSPSYEYDTLQNGYRCKACGNIFYDNSNVRVRGIIEEVTAKRNNLECIEALRTLEDAEEKNPNSSDLYFAKILARYGVVYVNDEGKTLVPTMTYPTEESIFDTEDYKKCIESAKDQTLKDYYNSQISEIEDLRKRILVESKDITPFDVIICADDKSESCKEIAEEYFKLLTSGKMLHNYATFYEPITLKDVSNVMTEIYVNKALNTAKYLIVIAGEHASGLKTTWNKNLLKRYFALVNIDKRRCEKEHGVLTILDGCLKGDLPSVVDTDENIIESKDKTILALLQKDLSRYVKKISANSSIVTRKIEVEEIKPIVINEIVIERKAFAKGAVTTVIEAGEKSKIDSAIDLLNHSAGNKYKRALTYANEVLEKNPQSEKAAFISILCYYHVNTLNDLANQSFTLAAEKNNILSLMATSLEYTSRNEYEVRMKAFCQMLYNTIYCGNFEEAKHAHSILIQYSDEKEGLAFTEESLRVLCAAIKMNKVKDSLLINRFFEESLYPIFTKTKDPYKIVDYYNLLGVSYQSSKKFKDAIKIYEEAIKIYPASPFALWHRMLANKKCNTEAEYGAKLSRKKEGQDFESITALINMMKGGYILGDAEDNYFHKAQMIAFVSLSHGSKKASVQFYEDLISIIPLEFSHLRYSAMITYPDFLCVKSMFKDADRFYSNVLKDYENDLNAYVGKLQCVAKAKTTFDLLVLSKSLDDGPYRKIFDTITELESRNNIKYSKIRALNNLRDNIIVTLKKQDKASLKVFKKGIEKANQICIHGLISPSMGFLTKILNEEAKIISAGSNEEYLAQELFTAYYCDKEQAKNKVLIENTVKSITKNVSLKDSTRGINLLVESLFIFIPAAICWMLFFGARIDYPLVKAWLWPSGWGYIAIGIGIIAALVSIGTGALCLVIGAAVGCAGSAILCGLATLVCLGLSSIGGWIIENRLIFLVIAICIAVIPYLIYKIIDIVKKRQYINKRYIVFSIIAFILLIISPIVIVIIR